MKSVNKVGPILKDIYEKELGKDPNELLDVRIKDLAYEVQTDWDRVLIDRLDVELYIDGADEKTKLRAKKNILKSLIILEKNRQNQK